jgi:proline iminopeptidase
VSKLESGQGYVLVNGFKLFYRTFGTGSNVLLCLHGGPGAIHDYLLPLGRLGDENLKVVLYDQLGCGRSQRPVDTSLFRADYYVEEVEGIRQALGLGRVNLMGSSWGGMLALLYTLRYQRNLKKLVTTGALVNTQQCVAEMNQLKTQLPNAVQETLAKYESAWAFWHPEYLKAVDVYYHNFLCRMPQWPEEVTRTLNETSVPVYFTMWGPNEFTALGNLKDLDFTGRLPEIHIPTLVGGGKYDEVTPTIAQSIHRGIERSEMITFENSAHLPMWEEQEEYLNTVREFIVSD